MAPHLRSSPDSWAAQTIAGAWRWSERRTSWPRCRVDIGVALRYWWRCGRSRAGSRLGHPVARTPLGARRWPARTLRRATGRRRRDLIIGHSEPPALRDRRTGRPQGQRRAGGPRPSCGWARPTPSATPATPSGASVSWTAAWRGREALLSWSSPTSRSGPSAPAGPRDPGPRRSTAALTRLRARSRPTGCGRSNRAMPS
jgi:hypothetical protein